MHEVINQTTMNYTEDSLVQQPTADYVEQLGWESVYAYNNEDFGPASLLGRTSDREVVLMRKSHSATTKVSRNPLAVTAQSPTWIHCRDTHRPRPGSNYPVPNSSYFSKFLAK